MDDAAGWHWWFKHHGGQQLREIVLRAWDPIGIAHVAEARDEYDGYLGQIADRLRRGVRTPELAGYLSQIRTERMGLRAHPHKDAEAAEQIVAWYATAEATGFKE